MKEIYKNLLKLWAEPLDADIIAGSRVKSLRFDHKQNFSLAVAIRNGLKSL